MILLFDLNDKMTQRIKSFFLFSASRFFFAWPPCFQWRLEKFSQNFFRTLESSKTDHLNNISSPPFSIATRKIFAKLFRKSRKIFASLWTTQTDHIEHEHIATSSFPYTTVRKGDNYFLSWLLTSRKHSTETSHRKSDQTSKTNPEIFWAQISLRRFIQKGSSIARSKANDAGFQNPFVPLKSYTKVKSYASKTCFFFNTAKTQLFRDAMVYIMGLYMT